MKKLHIYISAIVLFIELQRQVLKLLLMESWNTVKKSVRTSMSWTVTSFCWNGLRWLLILQGIQKHISVKVFGNWNLSKCKQPWNKCLFTILLLGYIKTHREWTILQQKKTRKSNVTAAFNNISTYRLVLHYWRREQGEKIPL